MKAYAVSNVTCSQMICASQHVILQTYDLYKSKKDRDPTEFDFYKAEGYSTLLTPYPISFQI